MSESVIEKRTPLAAYARRAGWVGCNILLSRIPDDGKIAVVSEGITLSKHTVRESFSRVQGLAELAPALRGWAVDVLTVIRRLGKEHFSLREIYEFEEELGALHPRNQNVRPKIRQQLQVLRDTGLISFTSPGNYRLTPSS